MNYYYNSNCCPRPRSCGYCPSPATNDCGCGCQPILTCDPCCQDSCCCQTGSSEHSHQHSQVTSTDDRSSSPLESQTSLISEPPPASYPTSYSTGTGTKTLSSADRNCCCDPAGACCLLNIIQTLNSLTKKCEPEVQKVLSRRILEVIQTSSQIIQVVRNPDGTVTSERQEKMTSVPEEEPQLPGWVKECTVVYEPKTCNGTKGNGACCCSPCQPACCGGNCGGCGCCQVFLQSYEDFIEGAEFEEKPKQVQAKPVHIQTEDEDPDPGWKSPFQNLGGRLKSDKLSDGQFKMYLPKCALFRDGCCCCSGDEETLDVDDEAAACHWSTLAKPIKRTLYYAYNPNPPPIEEDVTVYDDTELGIRKQHIRQLEMTLHALKHKLRQARAKISKTEREKQKQADLVRKAINQAIDDPQGSTFRSRTSLTSDLEFKQLEEDFGSATELNKEAVQNYNNIKSQYLAMEKHLLKLRPKIPVIFSNGEFIEQGGKLYRLKV